MLVGGLCHGFIFDASALEVARPQTNEVRLSQRHSIKYLLKELEGLDCGSGAGKQPLEVLLHHGRPDGRPGPRFNTV